MRIPLLKGEGGPKGRVRGEQMLLFTPHPPLRGTLSLQERDSAQNILQFERRFRRYSESAFSQLESGSKTLISAAAFAVSAPRSF